MASSAFHGLFNIHESSSSPKNGAIATPPATHQKTKTSARKAPSVIELDDITFGTQYNGPASEPQSEARTPKGGLVGAETVTGPMTPNELEMSRPSSPRREEAVEIVQRWNEPKMNIWRVASCCGIYFVNGIFDSSTGALIPYMETHYHIGYAVVSLIFVGQALGFIAAAFFNNIILSKLGRAKMLMTAMALMIAAFVILVCTPPYPVVVIAFFMVGYGAAMTLALNNVFCANLHPSTAVLGAAHGSYGVGGTFAPIAATSLVSNGTLWSRFYLIPLGLAVLDLFFAGWAFWHYEEDSHQTLLTALERTASRQATEEPEYSKMKDLKTALKSRVTLIGALFIFAYQGAEVSISGWVISFLINYRDGDPASVGYVTAGFWAGITLGRFVLTHLAPRVGERLFVFILVLGAAAFQLLAWLVPNVITNAVAVSILGLLLGPIYPCAQTIFTRLLPRHVQTTAVGFIGGAGSSGGAVAPFTTGILAQAVGTFVLHPVCIGLYAVMIACWFGLPKVGKRKE